MTPQLRRMMHFTISVDGESETLNIFFPVERAGGVSILDALRASPDLPDEWHDLVAAAMRDKGINNWTVTAWKVAHGIIGSGG